MIGAWEILLAFNRYPVDEGIDLTKAMACAIAQDIEKICADYEAQRAALAAAEEFVLMVAADDNSDEGTVRLETADKIPYLLTKIREVTK